MSSQEFKTDSGIIVDPFYNKLNQINDLSNPG